MLDISPTFLGTVQDVTGATVRVARDINTMGLTFIEGHGYRIGQIGSFVRIPMGYVDLFGIVSQVGAGAVPSSLAESEPYGHRWMTIQIVGEGSRRGDFVRGVSQFPTVGDQVHLVTEQDLSRIYGRPDSPNYVRIGHLASAESIPALVDINKLITRHSAIVGTTGSGKSTTVAGLLIGLSDPERYPSARIIVLDIHGEYGSALSDRAIVFKVNHDPVKNEKPLCVPYWALTFDELLSVSLGEISDDAARGACIEKITNMKANALQLKPRAGTTLENLTVDSPVPFSIHKMWFDLHRLMNATHTQSGGQSEETEAFEVDENDDAVEPGDAMRVVSPRYRPQTQAAGEDKIFLSSSPLNLRRPIERLASRLRDPRFDFLLSPREWTPGVDGIPKADLDVLLEEWIGGEQPISILDLSGIPPSILTELVGVLLRLIYDAMFWSRNLSEGGRERPLLIVLEEAHTYLGHDEKGAAARAVKKIVKEGRKYGIGSMVISQRPSEIDPTVLSQCGTIFAMRLSNSQDRAHVTSTVTDNLEGLLSSLPVLRTGEAIVVGEAVHLPVRTLIDPPAKNRRPDSSDPLVFVPGSDDDGPEGPGGWNRRREKSDYADVVKVWRQQNPRSPRIVSTEDEEADADE